ncbi:MAG: hypothetical protein ABH950_07270 [Candidatus Altiarchaeota archaeon]
MSAMDNLGPGTIVKKKNEKKKVKVAPPLVRDPIAEEEARRGISRDKGKMTPQTFKMLPSDIAPPLSGKSPGELLERKQVVSTEMGRAIHLFEKNRRQVTGRTIETLDESLTAGFHLINAKIDVADFLRHANRLSGDGPEGGGDDWGQNSKIMVEQIGDVKIKGVKGETAREFLEEVKAQDEKTYNRMQYVIVARDIEEQHEIKQNEKLARLIEQRKVKVVLQDEHDLSQSPHYIRHMGWGRDLFDTDRWIRRAGKFNEQWATLNIKQDLLIRNGKPLDMEGVLEFRRKFGKGQLQTGDVDPGVFDKIEWDAHVVPRSLDDYFKIKFQDGTETSLGQVVSKLTKDISSESDLKILVNIGLIKRVHESLRRLKKGGKLHVVGEGILDVKEDLPDDVFNPVGTDRRLPPKVQIPIMTMIFDELYKDAGYKVTVRELSSDEVVNITKKYLDVDERKQKYPLYSIHIEKTPDALEPASTERTPAEKLRESIFGEAAAGGLFTGETGESGVSQPSQTIKLPLDELDERPLQKSEKKKPTLMSEDEQPSLTLRSGSGREHLPRPTPRRRRTHQYSGPRGGDSQTGGSRKRSGLARRPTEDEGWPEEDWWDLLDEKTKQVADWWYDNANLRLTFIILGKYIPISGKFKKKRKKHKLDYEELLDMYQGLELVDVFGQG